MFHASWFLRIHGHGTITLGDTLSNADPSVSKCCNNYPSSELRLFSQGRCFSGQRPIQPSRFLIGASCSGREYGNCSASHSFSSSPLALARILAHCLFASRVTCVSMASFSNQGWGALSPCAMDIRPVSICKRIR